MSSDFTEVLMGFLLTLCAVAGVVLAWALVRLNPKRLAIDPLLLFGASLAAVLHIELEWGEISGAVSLLAQGVLLGLFLGRFWGRREATGRASPWPEQDPSA